MNTHNPVIELQKKYNAKKTGDYFFYAFILVYTAFMLFLCYNLSIEEDEAYSLTTTSHPITKIIGLSYFFEGQPPLYFLILTLWRNINDSIFFSRLISIIFTLAAAVVLKKALKSNFKSIYTNWIIVIFLINPYVVWASQQIRLYSFIILLSIVATHIFYQIYFFDKRKYLPLFIIICLSGIYTQYYFAILVIAFSVIVFVNKGWQAFFKFCISIIPVVILSLPNLFFIKEQIAIHEDHQIQYSLANKISSLIATAQVFMFDISNTPGGKLGRWGLRIIFGALFGYSIYKLYLKEKQQDESFRRLLDVIVTIGVITILFTVIYTATDLIYYDRYLSLAFPFYSSLFIVFGIFIVKYRNLVYGLFTIYFITILGYTYSPPFVKYDDQKSLAKYTSTIENKNEAIIFYDKSLVLRFNQFYNGDNQIISLPELKLNLYFFQDNFKDTIELKQSIDRLDNNSKSFLLITGNNEARKVRQALTDEMADVYILNNFYVSLDSVFKGKSKEYDLRIRRIIKKTSNLKQ